jgi:hypothetical protein
MPDPLIAIVNASSIIPNEALAQYSQDIQAQIDDDFSPIWGKRADITFVPQHGRPPTGSWPIYINRHSSDPDALGWHTQDGNKIMGRVFAGDCLKYGISVSVDLSHEVLEILGDPDCRQTMTLPDGRLAALEMCDPVESDRYAYMKGKTLVSDFILPPYFHPGAGATLYDFKGHLSGPCPMLTDGGYQSLYENGQWISVFARNVDGSFSYRSLRNGRQRRRFVDPASDPHPPQSDVR